MGWRGRLLVAGAALAALLVSGIALATVPGGDGTINGCYAKKDGSLRVVDSSAQCRGGESALTWNQTGPQGPKGDAGAAGAAGPKGDKGDAGPSGSAGPQGPKGDTGAAGSVGPKGDKGDAGPQGPAGAQGPAGGLLGYEVHSADFTIGNLSWQEGRAYCSAGKQPLGGGFWSTNENVRIVRSQPSIAGDNWYVLAYNSNIFGDSPIVTVYVICAST